ncbi:hypothetical protein SAMN05421810_104411 [Amycolatopsis arida]|uniref:Uncharacterized protein n=1 Tax=Amycolatopsis arida TaxID=587909 RepID=A0A1I5VK65_9PSEU|nr:hypothetical protein CLV69_11257 [Amycolatopsis arida]SFQ07944.1 hypothetical protein SAMN05421810_104411 [Amycolatopsis arida]
MWPDGVSVNVVAWPLNAATAVFLVAAVVIAAHATAPAAGRTWQGATSANGWPVLAEGEAEHFRIEGSTLSVRLTPAAAPVLLSVAR